MGSLRLTYANVISTLCLFLLLGGGAYAATQLPANSVGTRQLKKSAVTAAKVKEGSLLASDFAAGQIPAGPKGEPGQKGERGPQGEPGPEGKPGTAGATNVVTRLGPLKTLPTGIGGAIESIALCQPGERATGGGLSFAGSVLEATPLLADGPVVEELQMPGGPPMFKPPAEGEASTGWKVELAEIPSAGSEFRAYVICASP